MLYSIYDLDKRDVLYSGRNSIIEKVAVEAVVDLVIDSGDVEGEDIKTIRNSNLEEKKELLHQWNYEVVEHEGPYPEE